MFFLLVLVDEDYKLFQTIMVVEEEWNNGLKIDSKYQNVNYKSGW